jgi:hypothetical protein
LGARDWLEDWSRGGWRWFGRCFGLRRETAVGENVRDVVAQAVFPLRSGWLPLGKEERSNRRKRQFNLEFIECRAECGLKGGADKGFEAFPRKHDLATLEGLFSLSRREKQDHVRNV